MAANGAPSFVIGGGTVIVPVGPLYDAATSLAVQPDGKILLAGSSQVGDFNQFSLIRVNADGSLDAGFDADGVFATPVGSGESRCTGVALQADGKIVLAGYSQTAAGMEFALVRLNADGSPDTDFGGNGKLTLPVGDGGSYGRSVAIQDDGKIIVAGTSFDTTTGIQDFALIRLENDGSLDAGFGKVVIPLGAGTNGVGSVLIQDDGRIVVGGFSGDPDSDFSLIRLKADGSLDGSFGDGGKVVLPVGEGDDEGYSVAFLPDGRIILAGLSFNGSNTDFALICVTAEGVLDETFGTGGKVLVPVGEYSDDAFSVAVQADGKIVVAGRSSNGTGYDLALIRLEDDGSLDGSFGDGGKVVVPVGKGSDEPFHLAIQADGKIVVGGSGEGEGSSGYDFALVRLNGNGSLDGSFNGTDSLGGTAFFAKGGEAVVLDGDVQVYDPELAVADSYDGAVLTISRAGGASAEDVFAAIGTLGALTQGSVLAVNDTQIGTVTHNSGGRLELAFGAGATQELVNEAMRQIAYRNASEHPRASVSLEWRFSDGGTDGQGDDAKSSVGTTTVLITGAGYVVTGDLSKELAETNAALSASGKLVVADVDDPAPFQAGTLTGSLGGKLVLETDGGWRYDAASAHDDFKAGKTYVEAFTIRAADGTTATVAIRITGTNDLPISPGTRAVLSNGTEDKAYTLKLADLIAGFSDAERDELAVTGLSADHGKVKDNGNNTWTLTPDANYAGRVNLSYGVGDGAPGSGTAATHSLVLTAVNDAPSAISGKLSVWENAAAKTVVGTLGALDVDSTKFTFKLLDDAGGRFALSGKSVVVKDGLGLDFEQAKSHAITVEVRDDKGAAFTQKMTVGVFDVASETIVGDGRPNTIKGGAGSDRLTGGGGADSLWGGAGKDLFLFKALTDSTVSTKGQDTIFDFTAGDRFDLSAIDANGKAAGNQAFAFIGTTAFGRHAGELRFEKKASDTYVYADTNGDAKADFAFHLDDAVKLAKGDFIL